MNVFFLTNLKIACNFCNVHSLNMHTVNLRLNWFYLFPTKTNWGLIKNILLLNVSYGSYSNMLQLICGSICGKYIGQNIWY